jgi:DNA primase
MRTLLKGQDLADPKVKTEVTESLVPVIRQVSSSVERAHYAQKLARILKIDERTLLDMVTTTSAGRRQRRGPTEPAPGPIQRRGLDLETYCLRGLLQITQLRDEANMLMAQIELDPIAVSDFGSPENREIYRVWRQFVDTGNIPSVEQLAEALPDQLHARLNTLADDSWLTLRNTKWLLEAQVDPAQDIFDLEPDAMKQDLLTSLLKLRERSLLRQNAEIRFLLEDADEADARLYRHTTSKTIVALSRLQRMLSSRSSGEGQFPSDATNRVREG